MKALIKRISKYAVLFNSLLFLLITFQNCGKVEVSPRNLSLSSTVIEKESVSYLKIDNTSQDIFRAVFVVDMSDSMYSGPCPNSIDVSIPDVNPSTNCLGPTGVDPDGHRFDVMLSWLDDLQIKINEGKLTSDQVKVLVLPYSGSKILETNRWSIATANKLATSIGLKVETGFVNVEIAKNYLYILWGIEAKYHANSLNSKIPLNIRNAITTATYIAGEGNFKSSTGTSIVAPALETMNLQLNAELSKLKSSGLLGKAHFELTFFSDGVPKPHAVHIKEAIKFIWARKKEVCDGHILYPANANCEGGYSSEYGVATVDATSCIARCDEYLSTYADTGAVTMPGTESPTCASHYSIPYMCSGFTDGTSFSSRWTTQIKCGQCFKLVRQFDWTKSATSYQFYQDNFKNTVERIWGDWTDNSHVNIIGKLKSTVNMFKIQFPEAVWKMSFNRIDSANPAFQTQSGELVKDLNWIVRAKDYFEKKHRFFTLTNSAKPFELFQELQNGQSYRLGMLYVYNRNFRSDNSGSFLADSDGDGLSDDKEVSGQKSTARSDGVCLDSIKWRYGQCINSGCSPVIDRDGDGLNQCEEATVGTDDFDPDSDGDGILDGSEVLFGLNPRENDQSLYSNTDGASNFEHFIKGYSAAVNLKNISSEKIINISANLVDFKTVKDNRGLDVEVPGYKIKIANLPIDKGKTNEIVVIARIDNFSNPDDKKWYSKTYSITNPEDVLEIRLEDLAKLKLESP